LNNPNEDSQVKVQAIKGIGNQKDDKSADDIVHALHDQDQDVVQAACENLPAVNAVGASNQLVDMLQPGNAPPAVQQKAWEALSAFLPSLDRTDLQAYADRFRSATPPLMEKCKACLQAIVDKLVKSPNAKDLTYEIGLAHLNLGEALMDPTVADYGGAVSEFDAAISNLLSPTVKPSNARVTRAYRLRFQATLKTGQYSDAMNFAKDSISQGAFDAKDAGGWIADEVSDLKKSANQNPVLLDKATKLIDISQQQLQLPDPVLDNLKAMKNEIMAQEDRNRGAGYTTPDDGGINATIGATAKRDR
jgi:hypothetical protein